MDESLDIDANRLAQKYTRKILVARIMWMVGATLFRWSPRPCFRFRRILLRWFGATVGANVHVYPSATIYFPWNLTIEEGASIGENSLVYNLGVCRIGRRATISQRVHLCAGTHDYTDPSMPLLKVPIHIGDDAWVCADAFVGPGVVVGAGAIVGARAVAIKSVKPWMVVAGNPAKAVKIRQMKETRIPITYE